MPPTLGHMNDTASRNLRITLVDDDASVRSAVSRLLRSNNYTCKTYESAESALADPGFTTGDCLVLDVQLSGMNGPMKSRVEPRFERARLYRLRKKAVFGRADL